MGGWRGDFSLVNVANLGPRFSAGADRLTSQARRLVHRARLAVADARQLPFSAQ
jgi:hypothetical protein